MLAFVHPPHRFDVSCGEVAYQILMILHNKLQVSPFFLAEQDLLRRAFVVLQHLTADPRCLDGPFWNSGRGKSGSSCCGGVTF